jgi:hypothetical protein
VDTLPTSIVEPSTWWAMMLLGFTGLGYAGIARQGRAARRSLHSPLIDRALVLASATLAAVRAMRTGREVVVRRAPDCVSTSTSRIVPLKRG